MDQVTPAHRDIDIDPADAPDACCEPDTRPNGTATQTDTPTLIKQEEERSLPPSGDDGGGAVIERPAKRRRVEETTPHRSLSRAVSPPWKSFSAEGPTTVFENGVRKSSRVNRETAPPTPEPVKRNSRPTAKATQTNGTPKNGVKREARSASGVAKAKATPTLAKKASTASLATPARKSERQRRGAASAQTSSPASPAHQKKGVSEDTRKRSARSRRTRQASHDDADQDDGAPGANGHDPEAGLYASPDDSAPAPRLRLKFRKPDPPNRHPQHAPPKTKYTSIDEWLVQDDPLESEEAQRITHDKAQEEAERRLRIVDAAEHGVLSEARCSVFAPEPAPEPPLQYGHWDHVVSHALTFNKLLKEEKVVHRRVAKTLAREAYEFWKNKFKRKSQEEIDQEEAERQIIRYRQLVKDVKDAWGLVKVEIDKERVAKWEEEQLQLGQRAMDDMFLQAKEILGRNVNDGASSLVSDDRDFDGDEDEFASATSDLARSEKDDDVMSSSSDSEQENQEDEDANLTAEQLRAKYERLPDLPDSSSEVEMDESNDEHDEDEDEQTPAPTPDPELKDDRFTHTNGVHEHEGSDVEQKPGYIDPATVELEQVDEALLDSEDEDKASGSGSEAWSSDAESEADDMDDDETTNSVAESNDGSEGEDLGMMGFLAPKDIKKLKEAAKTAVNDEDTMDVAPTVEQTNGHGSTTVQGLENELHSNGHAHPDADENESRVNGESERPRTPQSIQKSEASPEDKVEQETSIFHSRQTSTPARTEVPFLLRGTLREYQHDGLDWLANLYESETNGILADEMGLGKTIQTISLLAYLAVRREIWGPHLVVVPTSVMLNWEMEFKKFLPGFKILTYYGDINERKRKRMGWRNIGKDMYNVVITSYQLILQDAAAFKMRPWQYLVLDEAHNIKNFKSQRWQTMLNLRTQRRLLLTGTPLQNNIDELWSLLYFLMPAGFAGEGRIAGLEEFTMALKNPTSQILDQGRQQLDAEAQKIVKKLHEVLRPYLLRRLKSEVEKQMPGKYEHVVYCKLSKRQRQLYDGFMGRASTKEILSSGNYMSIINCLMSLRKVCNHPDLFETRAIVTSMAMPKSVAAQFEIKDLLIRKRMQEGMDEKQVNLDALHLLFARREQTSKGHAIRTYPIRATRPLKDLIERQTRRLNEPSATSTSSLQSAMSAMARQEQVSVRDHLQTCLELTRSRTQFLPIYGKDCIEAVKVDWHDYTFGAIESVKPKLDLLPPTKYSRSQPVNRFQPSPQFGQAHVTYKSAQQLPEEVPLLPKRGRLGFRSPRSVAVKATWLNEQITHFYDMIPTLEERAEALEPLISRFTCVTPAVAAEELVPLSLSKRSVDLIRSSPLVRQRDPFHSPRIRQSIAFPDKRLLQYDCGKLQRLATLLRDLEAGGHRALIFTQMTKVLDILEQFLNIHGHRYLRLDGSTKIEQRQILTDRFNSDPKILAFILSSRSGGLGINLTGADTVIFYDLDWNPAMDKQCQDRAHRIGQTRDVHIYKFVSEYTIEANILRKSNQKRLLDDVIIQKGDFTTDTFNRVTWRDALDTQTPIDTTDEAGAAMERVLGEKAGLLGDSRVMGAVEDTEDLTAASLAQKEIVDEIQEDQVDFNESLQATRATSVAGGAAGGTRENADMRREGEEIVRRHVDEYMLALYREEFGKEAWRPPTDRQRRNRKGQDPHVRHRKRKY
ncbi:hypothetical protein IAQ61_001186 [Plenodomus lingam]|uniref:DNA helicase n=1 Tax=Leptosphaeria maculans (strain JN3 / isolate v23.1.3 / race Av1-4-5-6-7-8) TaxID=985895 RepID=E5A1N6_LEPMJ|nr:similar to helicase swr1 [Plenodomus lingam JN3]KAH9880892.1 hypothetical protein IAQ61_001186 [Plenodomus lingam]CBX97603.1 similar to helicase swr1 [Plenodomus lingam JN3]